MVEAVAGVVEVVASMVRAVARVVGVVASVVRAIADENVVDTEQIYASSVAVAVKLFMPVV
jgi:hypothetical protein